MRKLKLIVVNDGNADNPRHGDNLGTMVCFHNRYELGDEHGKDIEEAKAIYAKMLKQGVALPLYLYDHGGITMATKPFSCPWDSGQVGFIYTTKDAIRKWNQKKKTTKAMMEQAVCVLEAEVKLYDKWLRGEAFGYMVKDQFDNIIDDCWGYFGEEFARSEGEASLKWHNENEEKEIKEANNIMAL